MTVEEIAARLVAQAKRVSVAEADTCGLVGYLLSTVPGSSQFFPGGVIAYTGGLKQSVLGVSDELYKTKGSVSPEMAIAMARGVRRLTGRVPSRVVQMLVMGHSDYPCLLSQPSLNGDPVNQAPPEPPDVYCHRGRRHRRETVLPLRDHPALRAQDKTSQSAARSARRLARQHP